MTITVNEHQADCGCYIAGHWGQYGIDRLADVCEQFGIEVPEDDDPRVWRTRADSDEPVVERLNSPLGTQTLKPEDCWDRHMWAGDDLETRLNNVTKGGYWTWEDGEFFLVEDQPEQMICDKCGKIGSVEDLLFVAGECPDEDCDGTIQEYEGDE